MKKIRLFALSLLAMSLCAVGCDENKPDGPESGDKVSVAKIIAAADETYKTWEDAREIPATVSIDGKEYSTAEFLYLEATALVQVCASKTDDIAPVSYAAATNPDRDSYDKEEIAVTNGTKDAQGVAEDLCTIASRLLAAAAEKKQIPNQTLVYRTASDALAFSTNRAFVTIARALSEYNASGKVSASVSTEYLSGGASLYAFAVEFVKYLDVWENTVADLLSADGSHCEDNGTAWERVHFVPIPMETTNDWTKKGSQYDPKYQPYKTVEIEGTTYSAANCWEIAIRGIMDMCTAEGNDFLATMDRNDVPTFANGKSIKSAPIRKPSENCVWGKYPWYEFDGSATCPVSYNNEPLKEVDLRFIVKCCSWHVVRGLVANKYNTPLGMIGNYQQFGTTPSVLNLEGYSGFICPMREFLILARVYKYIVDNNITSNVYDAIKDQKFDFELYNQELPLITETKSLNFEAKGSDAKTIKFKATEAWTAEASEAWIKLDKTSGAAGEDIAISVSVEDWDNTTQGRSGSVTLKAGGYEKSVAIEQNLYVKPAAATLKDFAKEFVKALTVWQNTVGTVDADGKHNGATAWTNVHLIPIENPNPGFTNAGNQYDNALYPTKFTVKVGDDTFTSAQAWEIAQRGMLDLVTKEGSAELANFTGRNHPMTLANGASFEEAIPMYSSACKWGGNPWYEFDNLVKYNGAEITSVGVDFMVKVGAWHVVRSFVTNSANTALGNIGNFQEFGTNTSSTLVLEGYSGLISPMREFLILARFYKYLIDNNITTNVYDAVKDQKFAFDLY